MRVFPSPAKLVVQLLLRDEPALADTGTVDDPIYHVGDPEQRPLQLAGILPYAWVSQGSGSRDDLIDVTFVDVMFFTADPDAGRELAERAADQHIRRGRGVDGFGILQNGTGVAIRPQPVPSGTTNVSCHLVQFRVSTRRTGG